MPNVAVEKVNGGGKEAIPLFEEFAKRFEGVRQRAFELFEKRGGEIGHSIEDWIKAERELLRSPAAEFTDKGSGYELKIALPGFEVKDIQVTAAPDEIIVKAASRQEKKSEEDKVLWTEFSSSDLYRRFETPGPIDVEKTKATLEKGLLCITVPKAAEIKEKTVEVKAG
jgi:HSP20 family molecular chaperone IbpA